MDDEYKNIINELVEELKKKKMIEDIKNENFNTLSNLYTLFARTTFLFGYFYGKCDKTKAIFGEESNIPEDMKKEFYSDANYWGNYHILSKTLTKKFTEIIAHINSNDEDKMAKDKIFLAKLCILLDDDSDHKRSQLLHDFMYEIGEEYKSQKF